MVHETFLKRGRCGKIYKLAGPDETLIRKELSPSLTAKIGNWLLYRSPHPASTQDGWRYAYWKRRLGSRLAAVLGEPIHICDVLDKDDKRKNAFLTEFIEGTPPKKNDRAFILEKTQKLEEFFNEIGMPTWSFSRRNPLRSSNLLLKNGNIYIIDYEQSVPAPDFKGKIRYDEIDFGILEKFLKENAGRILEQIGATAAHETDIAFAEARSFYERMAITPRKGVAALEKIFSKS